MHNENESMKMRRRNPDKHYSKWISLFPASLFLLLLIGTATYGQTPQTITGVVSSNSDQMPLPGATVLIKGTNTGSTTNFEGEFSIQASESDVLVVSYIGYIPKEIQVGSQTNFEIALDEDIEQLEEIVVVGYGEQKKKLVTGAAVQVKGDDIANRATTGVLDGLQGQTAGVTITNTSGQPGESMKINIRGVGTIGDSGPLYIVDGVQTGDISYLNSADIQSIDVLKDAASAAIYGSQAANGVVLITTKTGSEGKTNISFDAYYGIMEPARQISMLNATEYAVIMNEAAINSGKAPYFTQDEIGALGEGTDWINEMIYDSPVTQNYVLGMNGGSAKSTYSMSLSYTGEEGIVGGPDLSEYNRTSFRINSDHKLYKDIIKVGQHLTFSYIDRNGISVGNQYNNSFRGAFNTSPLLPMYDDEGNFLNNVSGVLYNDGQTWDPWFTGESNPYASMVYNNQGENKTQKLLGNVYLEVNPIKNLKFTTRFGIDYSTNKTRSYSPEYELSIYAFRLYDQASQYMSDNMSWTWDNFAQYDITLGDKHNFSAMAGMTSYEYKGSYLSVTNADLITSDLDHAYIGNTTNQDFTRISFDGAPIDEEMRLSYFGRINYNFDEKYLLNATFRADGSSKFAKNNRWGYFPSLSAGWVISNEEMFDGMPDWISYLKLRASWGQVGSQKIEAWQYLAPISVDANYYFGSEDFNASGNAIGSYLSRLANEDIKWETSEQTDIGLDARFLDGKLNATIDWYRKSTKDWLLVAPSYATTGTEPPYFNGGNVINQGVELGLIWQEDKGDFSYNVAVNVTKNSNEVTDVPTEGEIVPGLQNMLYDNAGVFYHKARSGYPIGYFWGWETAGIFQNEDEVNTYTNGEGTVIQPNAKPGDLRYVDQNGDGVINDSDKVNVGDPNPDYTFSVNFGFNYKNFDFSVQTYGVAGNQIVQSYRNHANGYSNYTKEILNRWHGEGTSNTIPRVTETNVNYQFSDIFVKDGDFFRINNITLGYDFSNLIQKEFISRLRLYASVKNAFTFTKYDGMDPEVGYGLENGSSGVDLGFYPRARTYLMGVNVNF
ncbi:SusC/RagA family TonB-linked outer membrane protein [Chondrinema litorale]|uniref:SusC/RagA family TonB-linked outer membrane protein n=1 Tax=Chondrinema litorale TaxID=2994555 RepID=UPI002543B904|nr:TonB-dependent receptor [Chondrinema litorale]UZR99188.1 TonB-dependent receptor [Chondrinema litorale]